MRAMEVTVLTGAAAALYTLSAVAHLLLMARREYGSLARWSTRAAWLIQSAALLLLAVHAGRLPVYSLFEVSHLVTWLLVTAYIVIEWTQSNQAAGPFLIPVIAVVTVLSLTLPSIGVEPDLGSQPEKLVVWHVSITLLGYAFFIGSFVAGALYLIQDRNLRRKSFGPIYYMLPSLEALDLWAGRLVYIGFPLLTLGMSAGLAFAHVTWKTFWQADPKVIFTVFVWAVYGGYLLMRNVWGWGGRRAAWWVVGAGVALLVNWYLINAASGVHRFGV